MPPLVFSGVDRFPAQIPSRYQLSVVIPAGYWHMIDSGASHDDAYSRRPKQGKGTGYDKGYGKGKTYDA